MAENDRASRKWGILGSVFVLILLTPAPLNELGIEVQYPNWFAIPVALLAVGAFALHAYTYHLEGE
jgi:uncharacterized integral membrane protein